MSECDVVESKSQVEERGSHLRIAQPSELLSPQNCLVLRIAQSSELLTPQNCLLVGNPESPQNCLLLYLQAILSMLQQNAKVSHTSAKVLLSSTPTFCSKLDSHSRVRCSVEGRGGGRFVCLQRAKCSRLWSASKCLCKSV